MCPNELQRLLLLCQNKRNEETKAYLHCYQEDGRQIVQTITLGSLGEVAGREIRGLMIIRLDLEIGRQTPAQNSQCSWYDKAARPGRRHQIFLGPYRHSPFRRQRDGQNSPGREGKIGTNRGKPVLSQLHG